MSVPPPSPERLLVWLLVLIVFIVLLVLLFQLLDVHG